MFIPPSFNHLSVNYHLSPTPFPEKKNALYLLRREAVPGPKLTASGGESDRGQMTEFRMPTQVRKVSLRKQNKTKQNGVISLATKF